MAVGKSSKTTKKQKSLTAQEALTRLKLVAEAKKKSPQNQISKILADENLRSPILLVAEEPFRTKRFIEWIESNLFNEKDSFKSIYGQELNNKSVVESLRLEAATLSLFSKDSLIVVHEADSVKAAFAAPLAQAWKNPSPNISVILVCKDASSSAPLIKAIREHSTLVNIEQFKGKELATWLKKEATRLTNGAGIEDSAVQLLIKCYGENLTSLSHELEKLSLLSELGKPIQRALVEQISLQNPEHTSFELFDQLANRNAIGIVRLTKDLAGQGMHALQIASFISRCLRTALAHKEPGVSPTGELSNPWFVRKLSHTFSKFTQRDLIHALKVMRETDLQLKGSKLPDELTLTLALQKIGARVAS